MPPQEKVGSEYCMIDYIWTIWFISSPCILDKVIDLFCLGIQDGRSIEIDSTKAMHPSARKKVKSLEFCPPYIS